MNLDSRLALLADPRNRQPGTSKTAVRRLTLLACAALSVMALGCNGFMTGLTLRGSGRPMTQEYDFSGFDRVAVGSAFSAEITQGDEFSVAVTVDDNLVDRLDVEVAGDTLRIYMQPNLNLRNATLRALVTMPELRGLDLSGASRVKIAGFSSDQPFEGELSGASRLEGTIEMGNGKFSLSGASRVELEGEAADLKIEASGASRADLGKFAAQNVEAGASGASHIVVNAAGDLRIDASGASSVRYVGKPAKVMAHASGASSTGPK